VLIVDDDRNVRITSEMLLTAMDCVFPAGLPDFGISVR
jgi:hypothetical protein